MLLRFVTTQIVWDPVKKAWVNKHGDDNEGVVTAPPPTDNDLKGKATFYSCIFDSPVQMWLLKNDARCAQAVGRPQCVGLGLPVYG